MAKSKVDRAVVRAWVDSGEPRMQTIMRAADQWGLSHAEASRLVHEVLQEVVETVGGIDRSEFMAQQLTRLEALAVKAQEDGNLGVALSAFKEMHALIGLHAQR
jgi:hypothetical protein